MPILLKSGMKIVNRTHHGRKVKAIEQVAGQHRDHCLCWSCGHFNPDGKSENCPYANLLFGLCCVPGGPLVTPVYECEDWTLKISERESPGLEEE